ncbi:unnamed protein product [Heterobilharzia americana]|nr:unnamed protein product [Heterobilharzia americana]
MEICRDTSGIDGESILCSPCEKQAGKLPILRLILLPQKHSTGNLQFAASSKQRFRLRLSGFTTLGMLVKRQTKSMEAPLVMRVLAASVTLAEKASSLIRTVYASKDLAIVDKGVDDLQSRADRDSQRCVVQSLRKVFPGLHIIGEEGDLDPGNVPESSELSPEVLKHQCPPQLNSLSMDDIVVWVDPLDGTKEFTEGLLEYVTVLIGVSAGGKPVGGVVAQPFYHTNTVANGSAPQYVTRVVWGLVGLGIFGINPKLPSSQLPYPINQSAPKLSLPHAIVVTRSHRSPAHDIVNNAFYPTETVRAGGCGYKVLMLLEGRGHVYVFPSQGTKSGIHVHRKLSSWHLEAS